MRNNGCQRQWNGVLKVIHEITNKNDNCQSRIQFNTLKMSWKNGNEIKVFQERELIEYVANRPALEKIVKEVI